MIHDAVSLVVRPCAHKWAKRFRRAADHGGAPLLRLTPVPLLLEERLGVEEDPHAQTRLETTVDLLLDALGAPPGSSGQASAVRNP